MSQVKRYKAGMENEKGIATTTIIALATTAKATASKPKSSLRSSGSRPRSLQKSQSDGIRSFVLKINQADKRRVFRQYFQLILTVTDEIEQRNREIKLYMNLSSENERWRSVPFTHPATFDTVVMNPELKNKIRSDLENFCVWRRSFLLYDPYGTEKKTSFVAAMARFLSYDGYDVDMSKVADDSDLKMLLLQIPSIIGPFPIR
ncbi:hypothetical protein EV2_007415 [Malus domestica]